MIEAALARNVVLLAGAGVSAGPPSSLPAWKPLNAAIVRVLCDRLEQGTGRQGWLVEARTRIDRSRDQERFPPEYQAQLIEEMCGERYFEALQALDVDVRSPAHDAIAALASAGALRAIVTTNFDRLIERALDAREIPYVVAYDEAGFVRLREDRHAGLAIVKIHGCVTDHRSMIDTLKQRRLGRSAKLLAYLDELHSSYWIYAGFSAADLEGDDSYLGLCAGAKHSPGAVYIAWPGVPPKADRPLSPGATILMRAYGARGHTVVADVATYLADIYERLKSDRPTFAPMAGVTGSVAVDESLARWASQLSLPASGLCLGALLEAVGESELAVRILDRLIRHELLGEDERQDLDYPAVQLHYGRMGAALGRFVAVSDLGGAASNASVETMQSLLRLAHLGPQHYQLRVSAQLACAFLWLGQGGMARRACGSTLRTVVQALLGEQLPNERFADALGYSGPEDVVDAWQSCAQVAFLTEDEELLGVVMATQPRAREHAVACGDTVRAARVSALGLLLSSMRDDELPESPELVADFREAERVGDGFAIGMRALAIGRWLVFRAGRGSTLHDESPKRALTHLAVAIEHFQRQGMDPWIVFAEVQRAKAFADERELDQAQETLRSAMRALERFPIFASVVYEAAGQLHLMLAHVDPSARGDARDAFAVAIENAGAQSLGDLRLQRLQQYLAHIEELE